MSEQNRDQVNKALRDLHENINSSAPMPDEKNALLEPIRRDLDLAINEPQDTHDDNLLQRLSDSVSHFEVEHPDLTKVMNDVISVLSNSGV